MASKAIRGQKLADELARLADRLEGRFRRAFIQSMLEIADDKQLKKLLADIESGKFQVGDPLDPRLGAIQIDQALMNEISRQAIAGAAKATQTVMQLKGSFDVVSDSVINAARNLSVQLSTSLSRSTKEVLRQIIEEMVSGEISRREAVRRIQIEVGLLPKHAKAVSNYRKTLIAAGTTKARANQLAEAYAKRLLNYRANMIARTEVARANGIGQTEFWRQMRDKEVLPPETNRVWITAVDERACAFCLSMNGQVASIDGGWDTVNGYKEYPQASHPHCRCTAGITLRKQTKTGRMGAVSKIEEAEYDLLLHKHLGGKHDQSTHGRKGRATAPAFGREQEVYSGSREMLDSLPWEEKRAVQEYTNENYDALNTYLRTKHPAPKGMYEGSKEQIALIDSAFKKASATSTGEMRLYRGMTVAKTASEVSSSWVGRLKVGDTLTDKGFVSTSYNKVDAEMFAGSMGGAGVIFVIRAPKGTRVLAGSQAESELILNRGTKMRVTGIKQIPPRESGMGSAMEIEVEIL